MTTQQWPDEQESVKPEPDPQPPKQLTDDTEIRLGVPLKKLNGILVALSQSQAPYLEVSALITEVRKQADEYIKNWMGQK